MAKVLLIEPDTILAQTYASALEQAGHNVMMALNAQAGIDAADDNLPDMALLELQLVSHSGVEFLCEFRSYPEWQNVPVVIVSHVPPAEFQTSREVLKTQLGVHGYYYKPQVSLKKLLFIVDSVLALK